MEGCENCTLSPSIDGHWSQVSIFLLTIVYYKNNVNFGHAIPFFPVGLKLKVVKDVHFATLMIDTGLTSLSSC